MIQLRFAGHGAMALTAEKGIEDISVTSDCTVRGEVRRLGGDDALLRYEMKVGVKGFIATFSIDWEGSDEYASMGYQTPKHSSQRTSNRSMTGSMWSLIRSLDDGEMKYRLGFMENMWPITVEDGCDVMFATVTSVESPDGETLRGLRRWMREYNIRIARGLVEIVSRTAESDAPMFVDGGEGHFVVGSLPHSAKLGRAGTEFIARMSQHGGTALRCVVKDVDTRMTICEFDIRKGFTAFELVRRIMDVCRFSWNIGSATIESFDGGQDVESASGLW